MSCVITKLKGNKFNTDIYFKDVNPSTFFRSEKAYPKGEEIVLDLGVYDMIRD